VENQLSQFVLMEGLEGQSEPYRSGKLARF